MQQHGTEERSNFAHCVYSPFRFLKPILHEYVEEFGQSKVEIRGGPLPDNVPWRFSEMELPVSLATILKIADFDEALLFQRYFIRLASPSLDCLCTVEPKGGKTTAYLISLIKQIMQAEDPSFLSSESSTAPRALVVAATNESADRIACQAEALTQFSHVKIERLYGNTIQRDARRGAPILITTLDALVRNRPRSRVDFGVLQFVVVDDYDSLVDSFGDSEVTTRRDWFERNLRDFFGGDTRAYAIWLFASSLCESFEDVRARHNLKRNALKITVGPQFSYNPLIQMKLIDTRTMLNEFDQQQCVRMLDRVPEYIRISEEIGRENAIAQLLGNSTTSTFHRLVEILREDLPQNPRDGRWAHRSIIFVDSRESATALADRLGWSGFEAVALHGHLSKAARKRVVENFRESRIQVLVATDLAAHLNVGGVAHVLIYESLLRTTLWRDFCRRVSRAGLFGENGCVTIFWSFGIGAVSENTYHRQQEIDIFKRFVNSLLEESRLAEKAVPAFLETCITDLQHEIARYFF